MQTDFLQTLGDRIPGFRAALKDDGQALESWECLQPEKYLDKDVLDLGCGVGAASALFVARGARFVWGIDPVLSQENIQALNILPRARFTSSMLSLNLFGEQRFDLIYARFVTEHIYDLPNALETLFTLLKPGGHFVGLHDNYYGPMGAHDLGMIGPNDRDPVYQESKAVQCWAVSEKCTASSEFRKRYSEVHDWHARDWVLTPDDCSRCPYYRRAQLWAHLLYQDDYRQLYQGDFFRTSPGGGLNKITAYQLRQFLLETGFRLVVWNTIRIENAPPEVLLERFSLEDLQTGPILFHCEKPTPLVASQDEPTAQIRPGAPNDSVNILVRPREPGFHPDELQRRVLARPWYHTIDLGHGIVTPGYEQTPEKLKHLHIPADLSGRTVLDIGAFDGFFSFEAERRGAARVLATDHYCWVRSGMASKLGFDIAHEALNSKVESKIIRVEDLSPQTVGTFDLVLFLGVLYHSTDPFGYLQRVRSVCSGMAIIETHIDGLDYPRPVTVFYPRDTLNGDATNKWGPNLAAVRFMLEEVGFSRVQMFEPYSPNRVVAHAFA